MRPEPGTRLDVAMTKWGDRPHWEFSVTYLGSDEHGDWLGIPVGTHFGRPGAEYVAHNRQVTLLPCEGWWVATFHAPGATTWMTVPSCPTSNVARTRPSSRITATPPPRRCTRPGRRRRRRASHAPPAPPW